MVSLSAFLLLCAAFLSSHGNAQATTSRSIRKLDDSTTLRKLTAPGGNDDDTETIVSYFIVEYSANFKSLDDIDRAAKALAVAYNKLITLYDDPFDRRMDVVDGVDILEATVSNCRTRHLVEVVSTSVISSTSSTSSQNQGDENQVRKLQTGARILAILRQRGTSRSGCPGNCGYSNDSLRRALGTGYELDDDYDDYPSYSNDGDDYDYHSSNDDDGDDFNHNDEDDDDDGPNPPPNPSPPNGSALLPGLPSEEEIRIAYDAEIRAMDMSNIVGVTALEEVDEPPGSAGKGSTSGSNASKSTKASKSYIYKKSSKAQKSNWRGQWNGKV